MIRPRDDVGATPVALPPSDDFQYLCDSVAAPARLLNLAKGANSESHLGLASTGRTIGGRKEIVTYVLVLQR